MHITMVIGLYILLQSKTIKSFIDYIFGNDKLLRKMKDSQEYVDLMTKKAYELWDEDDFKGIEELLPVLEDAERYYCSTHQINDKSFSWSSSFFRELVKSRFLDF